MALLAVLVVAALAIAVIAFPLRKRSHVDILLDDVHRTEDEEDLAEAEEEVQSLDAMATPEDATQDLPDWGPGVPRQKRKR